MSHLRDNPKIIIPNFFTSLNMLLGFAGIYFAYIGQYTTAGWIMLLSVVMDKLDGTAARLLNASSDFGVEFDSFSDFFSFGIAPSMLYLFYFSNDKRSIPFYIIVACAVYILTAAMRLAKFNSSGKDDHEYFYGLTSTQSGAMLSSFFLIGIKYDLEIMKDSNFMAAMLIAHGILLVSTFKYPKFKKRKLQIFNILQTLMFALLLVLALTRQFPEIIYLSGLVYIIGGVIYTKINQKKEGRESNEEKTSAGH